MTAWIVCCAKGRPGVDRVFDIWSLHETQEGAKKRIEQLKELRTEIPSEQWKCHEMAIQK